MRRITALKTGVAAASLAVIFQAYLGLYSPPAYGICIICHARDLLFWLGNHIFQAQLPVAAASESWPLLTVVGVVLGARFAAGEYGEYKVQWIEGPVKAFILGALVMICGLLAMACPMRLLLRTAYGDFIALAATVFMVIGAIVGTFIIKWR